MVGSGRVKGWSLRKVRKKKKMEEGKGMGGEGRVRVGEENK